MLTNERGEIYSKSRHNRPYNEPLWEEFDTKGYVPREKRSLISAEYFAQGVENNRLIIFEPAYIRHRIMLYQQKLRGTFTLRALMLESKRPFSPDDEEVFEIFAKTAAYFLEGSKMVLEFNSSSYDFFLHELLSGHIDSEKNEQEIASYLLTQPGDHMVMLVFGQKYGDVARTSKQEARQALQEIFPKGISVIYEDNIIIFVNLRLQGGNLFLRKDRALAVMRKHRLGCVVSRYFERFQDVSLLYRQAAECLMLGEQLSPKSFVYAVGELQVPYLLSRLDGGMLHTLCYPPVLELLENQQEEYISTLYAYVLTLGNMARTAKLLGVHYNTAKYRVQKIAQLLETDLDTILPALYISLKALPMLRKGDAGAYFDMELEFQKQGIDSDG